MRSPSNSPDRPEKRPSASLHPTGGKLVAFFKRHTEIQDIVQSIDTFKPESVHIYHSETNDRTNAHYLKTIIQEKYPNTPAKLYNIDFNSQDDIAKALWEERDSKIICFKLADNVYNYTLLPLLYRKAAKVHISDGFPDTYGLYDYYRAIHGNKRFMPLHAALRWPALCLARPDYTFNSFPDAPTAFARQAFPVGEFPLTRERRDFLHALIERYKPSNFIFGGYDLDAPMLAQSTGIDSYIATTKDQKIICNGEEISTEGFICAEEIISLVKPRAIIGTVSTALIVAKLHYPDVPAVCILSPGPDRVWGRHLSTLFQKHTETLGVIFPEGNTVPARLENARKLLNGVV